MTTEKEQTKKQLEAELSKVKLKRPTKKHIHVELEIRKQFRFDKLCPVCGGPLEIGMSDRCWKCDVKIMARTQLDFIETGAMTIAYKLGVRSQPKPHRQSPTKKRKG